MDRGQAATSKGSRGWLLLGFCVLAVGLWFYSMGALAGRAGKSDTPLEGSLTGRGQGLREKMIGPCSPPGEAIHLGPEGRHGQGRGQELPQVHAHQ